MATNAGPQALAAFTRANNHYRAGIKRVDDFLQRIAGKVSPEDVFKAATRGAEGATTIRSIRRSLKPEEWDVVASTVLRRLGKATPGQQDELGEVFSVERFLTNWNRLPKESRDALFKGGNLDRYARDLDAIAATAARIREGSRVLANPSGTAGQAANIAATSQARWPIFCSVIALVPLSARFPIYGHPGEGV